MSYDDEFTHEAGCNEEIASSNERNKNERLHNELLGLWEATITAFIEHAHNIQHEQGNLALEVLIEEIEEESARAWKDFVQKLGV